MRHNLLYMASVVLTTIIFISSSSSVPLGFSFKTLFNATIPLRHTSFPPSAYKVWTKKVSESGFSKSNKKFDAYEVLTELPHIYTMRDQEKRFPSDSDKMLRKIILY
jgi:hypothetical protein